MTIEVPVRWSIDQLRERLNGKVALWASASVRERVAALLPEAICLPDPTGPTTQVPADASWLVVAGGGTLIDQAKALRETRPGLKLVAVPTIWGSGAEASPVIVISRDARKEIRISPAARPDAIVYWPEIARSVSPERQRHACGDCWAHTLEGFLSPLARPDLREALAPVMGRMLALPLNYHPDWFELSALACAGQAMASVGLVHGIAHVLEGPLRSQQPERDWHHAKLCSIFLEPVMEANRAGSEKWSQLMAQYRLVSESIFSVLHDLFEPDSYRAALPVLRQHWGNVLRDPCSRTNSVLVRPDWLGRLEEPASVIKSAP